MGFQKQFRPAGGKDSILQSNQAKTTAIGIVNLHVAHFKYDFSVDGGAVGEIIPANSPSIPANAIVYGVLISVSTALLAAAGAANISIGTHAGSSAAAIKAATAKATYSLAAILPGIPVFTAGSAFRMSVAGQMSITVDTNPLTAGVMEVFAFYVHPTA